MKRIVIILLLALALPLLASPAEAQGGPSEGLLDRVFTDLSTRIGKNVTWRRMDGRYLWEEVAASNDNLGCETPGAAAPGVTRAWKINIDLTGVGQYEYRASLDGNIVLFCTGTGLGISPTVTPGGAVVPSTGGGSGSSADQPPSTTATTTYASPVVGYLSDDGNVRVAQVGATTAPTAITGDANGGTLNLYWSANVLYSNLVWSPDGTRLAFTSVSNEGRDTRVWVATTGSAPVQVATGNYAVDLGIAWSPDGTEIAYPVATNQPANLPGDPNAQIYQMQAVSVLGGQPRVAGSIAYGVGCGGGGYSPARVRYYYASGYEGNPPGILWTNAGFVHKTNCTGRGLALTNFNGQRVWSGMYGRPALSPNGQTLVALQFTNMSPDPTGLILINVVNGQVTPLSAPLGLDQVGWSADGGTLYVSTRTLLRNVQAPANVSVFTEGVFTLTLWALPASGAATPTALYTGEGYAIVGIQASRTAAVIGFTLIESDETIVTTGKAPAPRLGFASTVPNTPGFPMFLLGAGSQMNFSAAAGFTAVPAAVIARNSDVSGTTGDNPLGLRVGGTAYVTPGGNVNVRREPAISADNVVGILRPGDVVNILNGPQVAGNLRWWQVSRVPDGLSGWVVDQYVDSAGKVETNILPR